MPDFSTIIQHPTIRAIVQQNMLERAFHDALFPRLLFRSEVVAQKWPDGVGDTQIFSAPGLMAVDARPLQPAVDPDPETYSVEQWESTLQTYGKAMDTHMPTSIVAIADLFLRNAQQLGMQAGQTLNRIVRNKLYGAALSGHTVVDGAHGVVTTIRLKRLNGFTRARRPDLAAGSPVRFDTVSTTNPLPVRLFDNGAEVTRNVIGFTPDVVGDEYGPGTVTISAATANVADRAYFLADDRTSLTRVGGGLKVDDLTPGADIPTLSDLRDCLATIRDNNVMPHSDARYHAHLDSKSEALVFADTELQRLMTALPDYYVYREFALGELLGTVFYRNTECPVVGTVVGGATAAFSARDPFVGELTTNGAAGGDKVHRILVTGMGGCMEYYQDLSGLITEAGITGKIGELKASNNGIEVLTERVQLVIRAPLNRFQDMVSTAWKFVGDWPMRTDSATGGAQRYKRCAVIEHCE